MRYQAAPPCSADCPCRTVAPDPNCQCGFTRCDRGDPYCEVSRLAERAVVSSKAAGGPGLSERDALLAAFDKMAEFHRAEARRRAGADTLAPSTAPTDGTATQSSTECSATAPDSVPRKKRRTRAEMQGVRAAKQRQITESYNSLVPAATRAWLDEPDPLLDSILGSTETSREKD